MIVALPALAAGESVVRDGAPAGAIGAEDGMLTRCDGSTITGFRAGAMGAMGATGVVGAGAPRRTGGSELGAGGATAGGSGVVVSGTASTGGTGLPSGAIVDGAGIGAG